MMIAREDIPVLKMAQLNWTAAFPVCVMASLACTSGSEENQEPMVRAVAGWAMVLARVVLVDTSCCWRIAVFSLFVSLDVFL